MADVKIFQYVKCSSCRQANTLLADSGLDVERRYIFKQPLSPREIRDLLGVMGKSPFELLSRRSIPYRQLGLASRTLTDNELIDLMAEHPGLMRRPIVIAGDAVLVWCSRSAVERVIANRRMS